MLFPVVDWIPEVSTLPTAAAAIVSGITIPYDAIAFAPKYRLMIMPSASMPSEATKSPRKVTKKFDLNSDFDNLLFMI
jgi:hypothetical protein